MATDRERVEMIVASALPLDPAARAAWLDRACGDDAALRAWAEALIRAREQQIARRGGGATPPAEAPAHAGNGKAHEPVADALARRRVPPDVDLSFLSLSSRSGSIGRLGRYEVREVLGHGGVGIVLRALDERLRRVVAIKVLQPAVAASPANAALRRQFLEEARAIAAVQHENVVAIHAVHDEPIPYFVMDYVAGPSLQQKLSETGPLELKQILRIGHQIAAGLAAIHRHGLLHRAIRPDNILLGEGVDRVKITDFGLASITVGIPTYMAPEQAMSDEVDQRADLFSLGTVLYLMCTGRAPFGEISSLAILKHVVEDEPRDIRELNRDIPPWLCEIIGKLHAKMPADRYQSAAEVAELLLERLAELQLHGEVAASPREVAPKPQPPRRRAWRSVVALLSFLIVFGDLLVAYYYDLPPFAPPAAAPSDESSPAAADEGVLDVQVADDALRITVRRVGAEPIDYAQDVEARPRSFTVQPGKIWVQATRDGVSVFEQFVEVGAGEKKSLSIDARASEMPPRREPLR